MVLVLNASEIARVLSYQTAVDAVEEAFCELGAGRVVMPPRVVINAGSEDRWTSAMPAYLPGKNQLGVKVVSAFRDNPQKYNLPTITGEVLLLDAKTGVPLAILDAASITSIRTAATSAVATKYLSRENSISLGIFGSGVQAEAHLLAIATVRNLDRVAVFDVLHNRCVEFCERMSKRVGIPAKPQEARRVSESDIVVTATTSAVPVFDGRWLRKGTHINGIGSHRRGERELDDVTICGSKVVVDSREAAMQEAGDILVPISKGLMSPETIYAELAEVVLRKKPGRVGDEEITVFKSVGLAIEDLAAATAAYEKAREVGVGREI
jgi:alanine dehydrogenase